jgi:hypothetical protein
LKKEPKNFCYLADAAHVDVGRVSKGAKVFCFFFSETKKAFLFSLGIFCPA